MEKLPQHILSVLFSRKIDCTFRTIVKLAILIICQSRNNQLRKNILLCFKTDEKRSRLCVITAKCSCFLNLSVENSKCIFDQFF